MRIAPAAKAALSLALNTFPDVHSTDQGMKKV
jgi:hypothetical protein